MNLEESMKILSILETAYPNYSKKLSTEELDNTGKLWLNMFGDIDYLDIGKAVGDFIKNDKSGFPPTIGQVNNLIDKKPSFLLANNNNDQIEFSSIEEWKGLYKQVFGTDPELKNLNDDESRRYIIKQLCER